MSWVVGALLGCQCLVVLFIALHDWIPLGKLNNLAGIRSVDTTGSGSATVWRYTAS